MIELKRLKLINWHNFENVTFDCARLTYMIGVNAVGKTTILDAIQKSGAAISHHHGIGKMFAPWLEGYIGEKEYGVFRVLKDYFDPDYTMNPGGTIGLDLKPEEKKCLNERKDYR